MQKILHINQDMSMFKMFIRMENTARANFIHMENTTMEVSTYMAKTITKYIQKTVDMDTYIELTIMENNIAI